MKRSFGKEANDMSKTVIIGGVAGGATTAARLRRKQEDMEIILLEKGSHISYANCGLPYYIGDVIKSRDALLLQTPEVMHKRFEIDVRIQNEALKIYPEKKSVEIINHVTKETYEESYDKLVIATGSSPIRPSIPGIDAEGVFTLWNVEDTDTIKRFIQEKSPNSAVVVGGGFIGIEMAENLRDIGMSVNLVELSSQILPPMDEEMAKLAEEEMQMQGIDLTLLDGVQSFQEEKGSLRVMLQSGKELQADMVIVSIGIRANSTLATEAGLTLNAKGGIITNEYMQTSNADIYAVGDVADIKNAVTEERTMVPMAGPANKQARICAGHITGEHKPYRGAMGTSVVKIFQMQAAATGYSEKALLRAGKKKGVDFDTVLINQKSHAGYYPGAKTLTLKLVYGMDGTILGAQALGKEGADKRIDVIAALMQQKGTVEDLTELELSYAPPFSSAKDPVNMLGFVAENKRKGLADFISPYELDVWMDTKEKEFILLDVTEEAERMVFTIPGSYHIPFGQIRERIGELEKEKTIIVYCAVGIRSYNTARILMQQGFKNVKVLEGGTLFYRSLHYKNEKIGETRHKVMGVRETLSEASKECVKETIYLDCCGLQCPGPVMKVNEKIAQLKDGDVLKVSASDMGFTIDIKVWCERTGNTFLSTKEEKDTYIAYLRKGSDVSLQAAEAEINPMGKTMIVFDGDFDKVLASFIIANGAASMGRPVTMFFTFWGLNVLRKNQKVSVKKNFIETMFGLMMPRGSKKLTLSKMNMAGMGTKLMRKVMKDKNVNSLEDLIKMAMNQGVRIVACTMSMDVMGIHKEELIDGIEYAGVASYLGDAEGSNVNLFI